MSATAYELLKSEIVSGKRKPGEVFEEKQFAAQLGVSRTPVREAVLQLAREGLLIIMPRRGTVVSTISMEDIRQLYEARRILEPQIMRIAAKRADADTLTRWKAYFENQLDAADDEGATLQFPGEGETQLCRDADAAFHLFLAQSQRIRNLSNRRRKSRYLASLTEHIGLAAALLQADGERAAREVLEHLHNSEDGYRTMMLIDAPDEIQMY